MATKKKKKKKRGVSLVTVLLLCVLGAGLGMLGVKYQDLKIKYAGEAKAYARELIRDLDEDSLEYKALTLFYTQEQLDNIKDNTVTVNDEPQTITTDESDSDDDGIEIVPIYGATYEGYMMLISNPEDISVAVNPYLGTSSAAPSLDDYVEMYNATAGINGGGFIDNGGTGNGSEPQGIVIHNGELVYGSSSDYLSIIGITDEYKLICSYGTATEALSWGVQEAVTFGPIFINNYTVVYEAGTDNLGMLNPRTAIGQRSDGTFMLLVIDGRGPSSFGAVYEDVIEIFQENDAVMAANLDGGNSSAMIYKGQYVNTPVSMYNSRNLPTVFLVQGDN